MILPVRGIRAATSN